MPLITCPDCKSEISDQAPACVKCGRPVTKAEPKPGVPYQPSTSSGQAIFIVTMVILGAVLIVTTCKGGSSTSKSASAPKARVFDDMDALLLCQMAMKSAARDPDEADIPYVKGTSDGTEYHFSWGRSTKLMRMRNGLGLEVPTSGSCSVSKTQKRITYLTLDGSTIIGK